MSEINRRAILAGTTAAAGTHTFCREFSGTRYASMAGKQVPGWYRYKVGEIEVTVVTDGARTFPLTDSYVTNVKKGDVSAVLAANFHGPVNITIVTRRSS